MHSLGRLADLLPHVFSHSEQEEDEKKQQRIKGWGEDGSALSACSDCSFSVSCTTRFWSIGHTGSFWGHLCMYGGTRIRYCSPLSYLPLLYQELVKSCTECDCAGNECWRCLVNSVFRQLIKMKSLSVWHEKNTLSIQKWNYDFVVFSFFDCSVGVINHSEYAYFCWQHWPPVYGTEELKRPLTEHTPLFLSLYYEEYVQCCPYCSATCTPFFFSQSAPELSPAQTWPSLSVCSFFSSHCFSSYAAAPPDDCKADCTLYNRLLEDMQHLGADSKT